MAHIFKQPTHDTKGILIFTHKEMTWFFGRTKSNLLKSLAKKPLKKSSEIVSDFLSRIDISSLFKKIRRNYFVGVNIGADPQRINFPINCDFYLAPKEVTPPNERIFKIPLNSRNFTPRCFYDRKYEKYWDIICISTIHKDKNLDLFLKNIRKIYDQGYNYKILLITRQNTTQKSSNVYSSLMDDYYNLFTFDERQNFTILHLSPEVAFPGLSREVIAHFYNSSKIFTLFSQSEGVSKAISEALCCGLPVVVKNDLRGGGRDYLNEKNSLYFTSYEKAYEVLIKAIENFDKFKIDSEQIRTQLGEESSIEELKKYFKILYEKHGYSFDRKLINTDRLNVRFGSHLNEGIEWNRGRYDTADIVSKKQLKIFLKNLDFTTFSK